MAIEKPLHRACGSTLRNRIAKSAMSENLAEKNLPGEKLCRLYETWGAGGLGLIITGNVMVDGDELGEPAVGVHAHAACVRAQGTLPGHAVAAASANQVTFDADNVAGGEVQYIRPYIYDLTNKFVADRRRHLDRLLCPRVPIIDMQVRTADPAAFDADHHVVYTHFRLGNILDPEARFSFALYDGFH